MTGEMGVEVLKIVFGILVSVVGTLAVFIFKGLAEDIKAMRESLVALNVRIAVIVQEVEQHSKRLERLEDKK